MYSVPILFLIFNRPEPTLKVFESIKQQKPSKLFIACDGPRIHVNGEEEIVQNLRKSIIDRIDWDCEVYTLFQNVNLGCGKSLSTAISWFFDNVEMGVILEDDVLPESTFYSFMQQMLVKYEKDETVFHITGQNLLLGKKTTSASYYFSAYPLIWGWASWRRAWRHYDYSLSSIEKQDMKEIPDSFLLIFQKMKDKLIDTWDYQWTFCVWKHKGLCIVPKVNLIHNLGFGSEATHTYNTPEWYDKLNNGSIGQIIHPENKEVNRAADSLYVRHIVNGEPSYLSLRNLKNSLHRIKNKFYVPK